MQVAHAEVSESEIPFDMPTLGMVSYELAHLTINIHPFHGPNNFATLVQNDNRISDITMYVHIRKQLLQFVIWTANPGSYICTTESNS